MFKWLIPVGKQLAAVVVPLLAERLLVELQRALAPRPVAPPAPQHGVPANDNRPSELS